MSFALAIELPVAAVPTEDQARREVARRDLETVRKVIDGDQDAYAELIRLHQPRILRTCFTMLANIIEAEDACQDVFIKAYEALPQFNGRSAFGTWVGRIASNHCMDMLRSRTRRKTQSLDGLMDSEDHPVDFPMAGPALLTATENAETVKTVLNSLTPDQRQILVLREVQGLRYDELSKELRCSVDAVKSRLRRAREALDAAARHFSKL